jgi:hypothetical protein
VEPKDRRPPPPPAQPDAFHILRRKAASALFRARHLLGLGRLPDALIIGAARCGTTSLFEYLSQHPNAAPSRIKELRFFDRQWLLGPRWYRANFPSGPERRLAFEATPFYLHEPLVPARVWSLIPDVKLVVMLREPVARAFSYWSARRAMGDETLPLEEAIEREGERGRSFWYVKGGSYGEQIERWLEHFPRSAFHFIKSEDFYRDPAAELGRLTAWLGLPDHRYENLTPRNPTSYPVALDPGLRSTLQRRFEASNARVAELTGISWP